MVKPKRTHIPKCLLLRLLKVLFKGKVTRKGSLWKGIVIHYHHTRSEFTNLPESLVCREWTLREGQGRREACKERLSRGVQTFAASGPHWKKKSCLGPRIKYIATHNQKNTLIMF